MDDVHGVTTISGAARLTPAEATRVRWPWRMNTVLKCNTRPNKAAQVRQPPRQSAPAPRVLRVRTAACVRLRWDNGS